MMPLAAVGESAAHTAAADCIMALDAMQRDLAASRLREQRLKDELFSTQLALRTAQSLIACMVYG